MRRVVMAVIPGMIGGVRRIPMNKSRTILQTIVVPISVDCSHL
jgi:hypothetical protein